jgi:hypothetical protein
LILLATVSPHPTRWGFFIYGDVGNMWGWDNKRHRYRNLETGRFLSAAGVRALSHQSIEYSKHQAADMARSVAQWTASHDNSLRSEDYSPLGQPESETVSISESDIDRAIREWDERMPPEYRGLLEAHPITPEESRALEGKFGKVVQCPHCREYITEKDRTCYHCGGKVNN